MYIEIGGIPQWVEVEPGPSGAPVILLVHGGPGASTRVASVMWQAWRQHFSLVHWDQRGAGRTFIRNGEQGCHPMSFERIVADGLEVAEHLRGKSGGDRLIVLGHSWGSAVGAHLVARCPDLFVAFVATGLLVDFDQNEVANHARLLALSAAAQNAEALAALSALAGPSYATPDAVRIHREWADKLAGGTGDTPAPRFTARPVNLTDTDRQAAADGFRFSVDTLFADLCAIDLRTLGPRFEVPMFCFMGTHDQQTPYALAERYFGEIDAPDKAFVPIEGCHHFAHINRADVFLALLLEHLQPLGLAAACTPANTPAAPIRM